MKHILITNIQLCMRTGTEIVTRDLARGFQSLGKQPMVYSPSLGAIAEEIAGAGIPVVDRLTDLPAVPQIIHGHHHVETLMALHAFPTAPAIFVCHDRTAWHDYPPVHPRLRTYVAVDFNCRERLVEEAFIGEECVRIIPNVVDLARFRSRTPLPKKPARALVFSNYAEPGGWLDTVQAACTQESLAVDVIGSGTNRGTHVPEEVLGKYDLVFGKGRCALEALATGCSVVICDSRGLAGLVTTKNVRAWRDWNLGARLMTRSLLVESIREEIHRYDPDDGADVSQFIRETAGLESALRAYLNLYGEAVQAQPENLSWPERLRLQLQSRQQQRDRAASSSPMVVLQASDVEKLRVVLDATPAEVGCAGRFTVRGHLHNGTAHVLSSMGGNPVAFSYHWRETRTDHMAVFENPRALLSMPVPPGYTLPFSMTVIAPERPGTYTLEFTLLQERLVWFDGLAPQFPVRREVFVVEAPSLVWQSWT
ncbi:MAG: hypothetical protein JO015_15305 [Verrucomicrobia bacterium]|nr:hypothetical protein [Verrucomicrobiota bacterium]